MEEKDKDNENLNQEEESTQTEDLQKVHDTLNELGELAKHDNADLEAITGKIKELKDGTQVLQGEFEDEEADEEEE